MEVKVPRDILKYEESMFFGLSLRQFLFAGMAVGMAVSAYFLFNPTLGMETTSWICIMGALPFAMLGFVHYNGMTADQFMKTWVRSEMLFPKVLVFRSSNLYQEMIEQGRVDEARPRRKPLFKLPSFRKKPDPKQRARREKDFERRGRNIYKFRRSVRFSR